jgi:hypothetical protein
MAMPPRPHKHQDYRPSIFPNFELTSQEENDCDVWKISQREAKLFVKSNKNITLEDILSLKIIENAANSSHSSQVSAFVAVVEQINDRKALLISSVNYNEYTPLLVDLGAMSLQNACFAMGLTL